MEPFDGRVAIVTGAAGGLGRQYAITLAELGASVVVNDVAHGGNERTDAKTVVGEIVENGGRAVASVDSVCDWDGARRLVDRAIESFGRLDVVVNNAGILRDRMLVNMSIEDFDAVLDVHLRGTFCTTRHAATYWREQSSTGLPVQASVVNITSGSGLYNNVGQANYAAAKSAIATFSQVAAKELRRYGVRVNVVAPLARTRMVEDTPALRDLADSTRDGRFDPWDPTHASMLVAYLAAPSCPVTGGIWQVFGTRIDLVTGHRPSGRHERDAPWTLEALHDELGQPDDTPFDLPSEAADAWQIVRDGVDSQRARSYGG